jgi:L,D-transpeptidase catalytic domain
MRVLSKPFNTGIAAFLLTFVGGSMPMASHASAFASPAVSRPTAAVENVRTKASAMFDADGWADVALGTIDRSVFALALESAQRAVARGEAEPSTLTVIDFSRPSTERRLWVIDLRSRELLFEEHVSHGRNSGHNVPTSFSNEEGSYKSSLGLFRAAEGYYGKHGYSLRLDGLEKGFNDRARERAIVVHGADYVNPAIAKKQGRLGRSLGCPALRPAITRELIDAVKEGGLLFAYYPDPTWLNASAYLN